MAVIPVKTGIQKWLISLDSRVRGNDENGSFLTFYEFVNIHSSIFNVRYRVEFPRLIRKRMVSPFL